MSVFLARTKPPPGDGPTVAVKDLIDMEGLPTTGGSLIGRGRIASGGTRHRGHTQPFGPNRELFRGARPKRIRRREYHALALSRQTVRQFRGLGGFAHSVGAQYTPDLPGFYGQIQGSA